MKIINYSHARNNLRAVLDSTKDGKPVIIKSKDSAAVVIEYNQYMDLIDTINSQELK